MKNQPKKQQLRQRRAWVKQALIQAGTQGMTLPDLLKLAQVNEPQLNRGTLAVWVADHQPQIQAERGNRTRKGFRYYHRGTLRSMGAKPHVETVRSPDPRTSHHPTLRQQRRVITIPLPRLPRVTRLRAYSVAVTVYALLITAAAL
jgi:hypothetical protein